MLRLILINFFWNFTKSNLVLSQTYPIPNDYQNISKTNFENFFLSQKKKKNNRENVWETNIKSVIIDLLYLIQIL